MKQEATTTRYAILGQLALREWSAYELTRSMRRSVRWFWPRVESVIYAEAKRLVADGLATSRPDPAATGRRPRTMYTITRAGRAALADWLRTEPSTQQTWSEPLLRVHLARFGTTEDLQRAVAWAEEVAVDLLADAREVATAFADGEHLFQDEAHIRGLLFDALSAQARALQAWATDTRAEVARWPSIDGDEAARARAVDRMRDFLANR